MSVEQIKKEGSSITYRIFEEAGKVECFIEYKRLLGDVMASLYKHNIELSNHFLVTLRDKYRLIEDRKFWGVAKCHPDNVFDKEVGMKVARSKALMKYYKMRIKIFREITEEIDRSLNCCEDALNYSWLSFNEHQDNYINSLKEK